MPLLHSMIGSEDLYVCIIIYMYMYIHIRVYLHSLVVVNPSKPE